MDKPRVILVGGGFGGIAAARGLAGAPVEITLLDKTNHHVFQPLLYQVATAALAPSDIVAPIRSILRGQKNVTVLLSAVTGIDVAGKAVVCDEGRRYGYDYLVLAGGARHSYFGRDDWEENAPGLKTIADALEVRSRFLRAFEEAEKSDDPAEQAAWLTFVLVGGGPTGCEMAGVLPEIARRALRPDFRHIDAGKARVILIENSPRVLNAFPDDLAQRAMRDLAKLGVEIRVGHKVEAIDEKGVVLDSGERIEARTVLWTAGNQASPLGRALGVPLDRGGRVIVAPDLSVPGHPEIFVVGDMAAAAWGEGKTVPPVAQGGIQGGAHAARCIRRHLQGQPTAPFVYRDLGNLAVLGRGAAIAQVGKMRFAGFCAWLFWLFVHLLKLVGFRNRLSVLLQWAYAYVTFQRGVRLIAQGKRPV